MGVTSPHNSAGESHVGVKLSSPLQPPVICLRTVSSKLFRLIDPREHLASKKLLRRREILERIRNLISPCITAVARSARTIFSRRG
jgi:hypothetical protein